MLKEVNWSEDRDYRTGNENEPVQFYLDGLCNSKSFDLLLGYFSSAAINVLSLGFASFLYSGGTMRMVVNNVLSQEDRDAIKAAKEGNVQDNVIDLTDIRQLKRNLDEYGKHFFECLAWLFANEKIQIKIIKPKLSRGISHYKSGTFFDGTDYVGFKASCNFTAFGLLENLEELDSFLSWENGRSNKWIKSQNKYFENIFSGNADFVEYLQIEDVAIAIKKEFGDKSINELIIQEKELLEKKSRVLERKGVRRSLEKVISRINEIISTPIFPFDSGPRPYQNEAYAKWVNNNSQGLFAMATGTGKTITSLNCLLQEYKKNYSYRAIIVVPTVALVNQWKKECVNFNFRKIYLINSKINWNDDVSALKTEYLLNEKTSFILIVTYASFVKPKFQLLLKDLPSDTLFIADEAHNLGAKNVSKTLINFELQKRIGLSATPDRKYDDVGNAIINQFFNSLSSYTFAYSMEEAINKGVLCKYRYYPHIVYLMPEEQKEYITISKALAKLYNSKSEGSFFDNPLVQIKLLERKRIIHKAQNKLAAFKKILANEFVSRGNLKYTLIYVPEGNLNLENDEEFGDIHQDIDTSEENVDDERLIDMYTRAVRDVDERILVGQYTSRTGNRESLLKQFAVGEIDVLTSMKCLDEGVDVPRAELAIFCASTGNPRQFVQRRGRVLRKHDNKIRAIIHDLVIVPLIDPESETFEVERGMLQRELERVVNFSSLSTNKMDTYLELKEILEQYRLNLYQQ